MGESPSPSKRPAIVVDLGMLDLGLPGAVGGTKKPTRDPLFGFVDQTEDELSPWPFGGDEQEAQQRPVDPWPLPDHRPCPAPIQRPKQRRGPWPQSGMLLEDDLWPLETPRERMHRADYRPVSEENQQLQMWRMQQELAVYEENRRQQLQHEQHSRLRTEQHQQEQVLREHLQKNRERQRKLQLELHQFEHPEMQQLKRQQEVLFKELQLPAIPLTC